MDDFANVIKRDPQAQIKTRDELDKYTRLPYSYQSEIGYDTLIQNVFPKGMINLMATTIVDIHIELKMKISGTKCLESKKLVQL